MNTVMNLSYLNQFTPILAENLNPQAIVLYGSHAQNLHDEKSDFDLLAFFPRIPSPEARQEAYRKIPDAKILEIAPKALVLNKGWDNSWSPTNDKLLIHGKHVEISYNTIDWVNQVVDALVVKHQTTCKEFSFRPYTFLGLLETCKVLYDPQNFIQQVRSQIRPIPEPLKAKIIQEFLPILQEAHEELLDYAKRKIGILAYQFHLFRAIDALIQILFVLNDVYDPAFKRLEPFLLNLKILPPFFEKFLLTILPRFYEKQQEISHFLEEALQFIHRNLQTDNLLINFTFKRAEKSQKKLIHEWLQQEHINKWIHGVGLNNTLTSLEQFFQGNGDTTYWIGYYNQIPFAFLITSPAGNDATTLDLFICELDYLGKGLAVPMIQEFLVIHFPHMKRILIDPEATNSRAIHVYQKAGFKITGEFIANWHPVPHYQMELHMKDLLNTRAT